VRYVHHEEFVVTRKRKRLVIGDRIMILAPPRKRAPVRIDRRVPSTWEEYEQLRADRQLEAERSALFAAMRSVAVDEHDAAMDVAAPADGNGHADDGEGEATRVANSKGAAT
jgi:hypothetical protein